MSILDEAENIVAGDRYGSAERNLGQISELWSAYLGHTVSPRQVAMCMILLKVGRDGILDKRDNLVDIAGYAALADQLEPVPADLAGKAFDRDGNKWLATVFGWWCPVHDMGFTPGPDDPGMDWADVVEAYGPMRNTR